MTEHDTVSPVETNRQSFYSGVRAFLIEASPNVDPTCITEEGNLVDAGAIDSLRMVELIVAVEKLLSIEIPVHEGLDPRAFHSMKAIYDNFAVRS